MTFVSRKAFLMSVVLVALAMTVPMLSGSVKASGPSLMDSALVTSVPPGLNHCADDPGSFAYTVSSSDTVLLVVLSGDAGLFSPPVPYNDMNVMYNNVNMARIASYSILSNVSYEMIAVWGLNNPATGTHNIGVTSGPNSNIPFKYELTAMGYSGATVTGAIATAGVSSPGLITRTPVSITSQTPSISNAVTAVFVSTQWAGNFGATPISTSTPTQVGGGWSNELSCNVGYGAFSQISKGGTVGYTVVANDNLSSNKVRASILTVTLLELPVQCSLNDTLPGVLTVIAVVIGASLLLGLFVMFVGSGNTLSSGMKGDRESIVAMVVVVISVVVTILITASLIPNFVCR